MIWVCLVLFLLIISCKLKRRRIRAVHVLDLLFTGKKQKKISASQGKGKEGGGENEEKGKIGTGNMYFLFLWLVSGRKNGGKTK